MDRDDHRPAAPAAELSVAVVIPVHDGADGWTTCLESVAVLDPPADQVVVVGDGGGDPALEMARGLGFDRVRLETRRGPAAARNRGAATASADLLLFVDADVAVRADTAARVRRAFARWPEAAAVFGSYDDRPPAQGLVSRFKNLLHHWTHQHAALEASTFWTGCGAVRRRVFEEVGGFDPGQAWLEDVELGLRLRAAGHRIVLDPTLLATHLKRWTLRRLLISDILHRAWPWTELAHRYRALPRDLNLDWRSRASGALSLGLGAALAAMAWVEWTAVAAAAAAVCLVGLNLPLYRFLATRGGAAFLAGAVPLHWLYFGYGSVTFALGTVWWTVRGRRRSPARSASSGPAGDPPAAEPPAHRDPDAPSQGPASRPSADRRSA